MANKLKIALIGYGKMGRLIEQIAEGRGHRVIARINRASSDEDWLAVKEADVAIEFTRPDAAVNNIERTIDLGVPLVVGTTGWFERLPEITAYCKERDGGLLTASNFSLGVNLFFHINRLLAKAMNEIPDYNVRIEEIHHTQKLDSPSGTAISIAEGILAGLDRKNHWVLSDQMLADPDLAIDAKRQDEVPGTHTVVYSSPVDDIEIRHTAHNRSGFATGAVVAAEWLSGKQGCFTMSDIIGF